MSNFNFGEDFKVGNYIKPVNEFVDERRNYIFSSLNYTSYEIEKAKEWARDAMRTIITPTSTLRELEELWFNFCNMSLDKRIESDDISMRLFGLNNQYHYEYLKKEFLKDDIERVPVEDMTESSTLTNGSQFEGVEYTPLDIEKAIEWTNKSGIPIIRPMNNLEELEELWVTFNSFPISSRDISDDESIRIFGICNHEHYKYLKSEYIKENIPYTFEKDVQEIVESTILNDSINFHKTFAKNESVSALTKAEDLLGLITKQNEAYTDYLISGVVNDAIHSHLTTYNDIHYDLMPYDDTPFFSPDEMIDFGVNQANPEDNFYEVSPIADVISEDMENWFKKYCEACCGYGREYNAAKWSDTIRKLFLKRESAEDPAPYNQAILNLGWPPESEFSPKNRALASKRLKYRLNDICGGSTQFVDLTDMEPGEINESTATEDSKLYPVYIVLHEGKTAFSKAIKKVTKSVYSHAAISFDSELTEMYSYGIEGSEKKSGGFIKEYIKDKDPAMRMAVFTIFLKKEDWQKLQDTVDSFIKNAKKTSYSYINLIVSHIFHIPMDMDMKMVCSQFVDKVLKLTDIDISHKNSSLVNPSDFEKFAKENKKIYILFNDLVANYKPSKIKALINRLSKKADPIKEQILWTDSLGIVFEMMNNIRNLSALQELSTKVNLSDLDHRAKAIYEAFIAPCLEAEEYFAEAKNFPIQFDKDGNLFIKNVKKRDYEAEYAKSHKLLRKYEESGNLEGIKYELCKLWMMNSVIEEKLHSKKFEELPSFAIETSAEHKARAKILNDFNHFLKVVLEEEKDFNFEEFFNNSPFSDALIKINKNTIIWSAKLLKTILSGL